MSNSQTSGSDGAGCGVVALILLGIVGFISEHWAGTVQVMIIGGLVAAIGTIAYLMWLIVGPFITNMYKKMQQRRIERARCPVCNGFGSVIMHDFTGDWCTPHRSRKQAISERERVLMMDNTWW